MGNLTPKQQRFVAEYLVDLNATKAAERAGYSAKTARQQGARLLSNAAIADSVARGKRASFERVEVKADDVLRELLRIGLVDLRQAFTAEGALKPIHEMPEDVARALAGVEVEELFEGKGEERAQTGRLRKVKFWDKPRALELLGKHLKLFVDKVEHAGDGGGPIVVEVRKYDDASAVAAAVVAPVGAQQAEEAPLVDVRTLDGEGS